MLVVCKTSAPDDVQALNAEFVVVVASPIETSPVIIC
jgi:hypothetical protein